MSSLPPTCQGLNERINGRSTLDPPIQNRLRREMRPTEQAQYIGKAYFHSPARFQNFRHTEDERHER